MYNAKIVAFGNPDTLIKCFNPEDLSFERSSTTINKIDDGLEFNIESKDATALRASLNSVGQLLIVFENAKKQ